MINIFNFFVKITGYIPNLFCFHTKVFYEDKTKSSRILKDKTIVVSNHTSIYDYAVYLFVFFFNTLRCQMAEVLFNKKVLGLFLKMMGGIRVDRNSHDFSFLLKSEKILKKKGKVLVFPESRLPKENEKTPLEFKPSAIYLALNTDTKIIPVYTNGCYFKFKRAKVVIGKPFDPNDYYDKNKSDKENIEFINNKLRERIIELENLCNSYNAK